MDGGAEEIKEQSQKSAVNDDDSQQDLFGDYYKSLHNVIRAEVPEKNKATESEEENSELVLELAAEDSASQENRGALAEMTQDEGEILPVARFNESNDSESSNLEELCTPFLSNNPVVVRIPFEQWDATKENWASPVHGSERAEVFEEDERDFAGDATQVE